MASSAELNGAIWAKIAAFRGDDDASKSNRSSAFVVDVVRNVIDKVYRVIGYNIHLWFMYCRHVHLDFVN